MKRRWLIEFAEVSALVFFSQAIYGWLFGSPVYHVSLIAQVDHTAHELIGAGIACWWISRRPA